MKKLLLFTLILFSVAGVFALAPTISSISPASGAAGTLVTISGTNLSTPTSFTIGGVTAITISATNTQLVGMVMPGAVTGKATVTTAGGSVSSTSNFTVTPTPYPATQQGTKLVGTGRIGNGLQGYSVAVSGDGNTAIVGAFNDNSGAGAAWIYTRSGGVWTQQGAKLVGTGAVGTAQFGYSVAISADGNTAIVGGYNDNTKQGAAWVYTRSSGVWTQQGNKLVGTGNVGAAGQGYAVSISADGNTAIVGGFADNNYQGAVWVYTRSGRVWSQQGSKLVGTGNTGAAYQGSAISLSADGNTAIVGGYRDNALQGAVWVFSRSGSTWAQQGGKLVGTGNIGAAWQGNSVAISADGNTAIAGGYYDNTNQGAAWVYTRTGSIWSQQGSKLVGTGNVGAAWQGSSVSISADGNTAVIGGNKDNANRGAIWAYTRSGGTWTQQGAKQLGTGPAGLALQGGSVAISADGTTAFEGGSSDNSNIGAVWAYSYIPPPPTTITAISPASGPVGTLVTITGTNLSSPSSFTIGGVTAIVVSNSDTKLVGMVMPGATSGTTSITTANGTASSSGTFTVTTTPFPAMQQGTKLVGTGAVGNGLQGYSVAVSGDGNTAIVGAFNDNSGTGAAWIYNRRAGTWIQQGAKLVGTGAVGAAYQGYSVAISADGNTAIVGGYNDNAKQGAAWLYTRSSGTWVQQGNKLVGTSNVGAAGQGTSVAISADGNTAIVGGSTDNNYQGAVWVFTQSSGTWAQQGSKLVGTGNTGIAYQGNAIALSADGNTAIVGGFRDNANQGAAWIFTRSGNTWAQQGSKLVGTGNIGAAFQGNSVSISADGNTAIAGGYYDNTNQGAAWVYTRTGSTWSQQGSKLVGTGNVGAAWQGSSVSISADGNTAVIGGNKDNANRGAVWTYTRTGGMWTQRGAKQLGTGPAGLALQGGAVAVSADGTTAFAGGTGDNSNAGAVWAYINVPVPAPTISSISPASGPVGTLLTINGTNLNTPTAFTIGGVTAIIISNNGTQLVGMVMPGAVTGAASVSTAGGRANSMGNFSVTPTLYPNTQQGTKLVGTGGLGNSQQGTSVAVSADGNTAIVGAALDNSNVGAAWIYTRTGGIWAQQGLKLIGTGAVLQAGQGNAVALSADGNTALVGGVADNSGAGAVWVFTRSAATWTQQGEKLVGSGAIGFALLGGSISLSADGNTAIIGGVNDNSGAGAAWIFTRNGSIWSQQGAKLVGTGAVGAARQGNSVSLSADGNTAIVGGKYDTNYQGASWVYTRNGNVWSQQGQKLVGTGAVGVAQQGCSVSISADGNTAIIGGVGDNSLIGAAWMFSRVGGTWAQVGSKLVGTGTDGASFQGASVSLSADGNTVLVGGYTDNNLLGAAWVYTRSGDTWTQRGNKIVGADAVGAAFMGWSVSISADGSTGLVGGPEDNSNQGALWAYSYVQPVPPTITSITPASGAVGALITITGTNLSSTTAFTIGGVPAIIVSSSGTQLVGMVMPGTVGGKASITTSSGAVSSAGTFTVTPTTYPTSQQGNKLVGTGAVGAAQLGTSVAVSADGNTAIVGGSNDNNNVGAAWIYIRNSNTWTQQGAKLVGTGATGPAWQGSSVAISADGNTAIVGGASDNSGVGAAWIYTRSGSIWAQQGSKLVGTGSVGAGAQGNAVSLSADGNTAIVAGQGDASGTGAVWVFIHIGGKWIQQGAKLVGITSSSTAQQGSSVCLSADGNNVIVGAAYDNSSQGAAWIFTRNGTIWSQQGNKLVGTGIGSAANQGSAVSISADGNTAAIGGSIDNTDQGATWVFIRNNGVWSQQGAKLFGTGGVYFPDQGRSVALSADGNTLITGGPGDNSGLGAVWAFTRSGATWTQRGTKLVGTGAIGSTVYQGLAAAISADGSTMIVGGPQDNSNAGAIWAYSYVPIPAPTITAISPTSGPVGTLVTVTGTNFDNNTAFKIGGVPAITISATSTQIVGMVMPGATTGAVAITTGGGTANSAGNFTVTAPLYPTAQQGTKLVGVGSSSAQQGWSVSVSADGNTAIVGGVYDNGLSGAVWIYTRTGGVWAQLGTKLTSPSASPGGTQYGFSAALSADGNTAIVGARFDNNNTGAAWVYSRNGNTWTQQSVKLVASDLVADAEFGYALALSADGNTAIITGANDNYQQGAAWIFTRSGNIWTQQGTKLVGTGAVGNSYEGYSAALSADGNTAIIGGVMDNGNQGAVWIFNHNGNTWAQQGAKLVGTGAIGAAEQGRAVSLSADGNTAMVGGFYDNNSLGAAWVYTRNGSTWTQQGAKLVGTGGTSFAEQGISVSLSADGNTAIVGATYDNSGLGAAWLYTRSGGVWTQKGSKLVGTGSVSASQQGYFVSISADANTAIIGAPGDNYNTGAMWAFAQPSTDASLSGLTATTLTLNPVFAPATKTYTATALNTISSITLTPVANNANATIAVNGTTVASGSPSGNIALNGGNTVISTIVTAQDGTTKQTYTLTVTRTLSTVAYLSNLVPSAGSLNMAFSQNTNAYTVTVGNTITSINITPTTLDVTATVKVNGTIVNSGSACPSIPLSVGSNVITTIVTAQDGTTTKTYTVTVTRVPSSVAYLSNLATSSGTLTPTFSSLTMTYTAAVTNATTSITVTPTVLDPTAMVKVNGTTVASGSASGAIALNVGNNVVTMVATAQDGTTTQTYTVTVTRASGSTGSLVLVPVPTITVIGSANFAANGSSVTLAANPASGYNYQWAKDGININGANSANYTATQGGSYTVSIATDEITKLSEPALLTTAFAYPNPVSSIININLGDVVQSLAVIDIYNANGVKVYTHQFTGQSGFTNLDLSSLNPGVYILKLNANSTVKTCRIIKI